MFGIAFDKQDVRETWNLTLELKMVRFCGEKCSEEQFSHMSDIMYLKTSSVGAILPIFKEGYLAEGIIKLTKLGLGLGVKVRQKSDS